ncbi:MAG: hypothetical protein JSS67_08225 [Bacteroidetes bacterium]|nr:hypothetical protein [Bacteroidota bacterium]
MYNKKHRKFTALTMKAFAFLCINCLLTFSAVSYAAIPGNSMQHETIIPGQNNAFPEEIQFHHSVSFECGVNRSYRTKQIPSFFSYRKDASCEGSNNLEKSKRPLWFEFCKPGYYSFLSLYYLY